MLCALACLLSVCDCAEAAQDDQRPNVVFLLADDLGWTGLGCFGSDFYETPNLDRLAESGMKFTNAYAACTVCSPTRASIMTGMYPARLRLTDFIAGQNRPWAKLRIPAWNKGLDHSYVTLAEALRDAGYKTAQVGKWHLNHAGRPVAEYGPESHGFEIAIGKPRGTKGYVLPQRASESDESGSGYLTDHLTDKAVEFIDETKDKPFFLYFAYHTPHTPIQGRKDLVEAFTKKVNADAVHKNPVYAAMVASLDQSAGRILERLDRHGIADNTLVIFTSDNGGLTQRYGKHDGFTENLPLRHGKGSAYEGGVRVPTIIRWPGVTKPGAVCDKPIISMDFYPTILDVTSAAGDKKHNKSVDGVSAAPLLRDSKATIERDLFWHYPHYHAGGDSPYSAVRSGDWRLIEFHEDSSLALYDLAADPGEQKNLARQVPTMAKELHNRLKNWREQIEAQMPSPNPNYDPKRATQVSRARR
jgi:arylsulfatase A-like enzyme